MGKRKRKQRKGMQGVRAATPEGCPPTPEFAAKNALEKVKTDQGSYTLRVRDKRPIDKYHRLYCIDRDRGIGEYYRRGIDEEQFRAADRLACNYERGFPRLSLSPDAVRVQTTVNVGMYGFAYRILDAQYFGVPQRRRRVFVVGYLGDWRPAAAVLFEREGLCGDITPGRKAREGIAGTITSGAGRRRGGGQQSESLTAHALEANNGGVSGKEGRGLVTHTLRGDGFDASEDGTGRGTPLVAGTVSSKWAKGTGGPSGDECQNLIAFSAKDYGADADECAPTLRAMCHAESHQNGGGQIAVAIPLQEIGKRTGKSTDDASIGIGIGGDGDAMFTLQAGAQHGVASFKPGQSAESRGIGYDDRLSPSLEAGGGGNNRPAVMQHMAVRRLTPRECERLQGFPDD